MKHIFHVHTIRCGHASEESDEEYIKTAIELGAEKISFTDHSPFPGNTFRNRMNIEDLPSYTESLNRLKNKYSGKIDIEIGLEIEYLPSQNSFYRELHEKYGLNLLIIGQHFYEHSDGHYSFNDDKEFNKENEFIGCGNAIIEGCETGFFNVVAHPDRIFRRCKNWTPQMEDISLQIIDVAAQKHILLEKNLSSYEKFVNGSSFIYWRKEFWDLVEKYNHTALTKVNTITGYDAHSTLDMKQKDIFVGI